MVLSECIIRYFWVTHEAPEDDGCGTIYSWGSCFTRKSHQFLCTGWDVPLSTEEENHKNKVPNQLWRCICNVIRKNVNMAPGSGTRMFHMWAPESGAERVSQGFRGAGVLSILPEVRAQKACLSQRFFSLTAKPPLTTRVLWQITKWFLHTQMNSFNPRRPS